MPSKNPWLVFLKAYRSKHKSIHEGVHEARGSRVQEEEKNDEKVSE